MQSRVPPSALRRSARIGSLLGSLVLALALAFAPVQSRGQQAELFALLAFFLLVGTASAAVPRTVTSTPRAR